MNLKLIKNNDVIIINTILLHQYIYIYIYILSIRINKYIILNV